MHSPKKTYSRTEIQLNYGVESNHLGNVLATISARPRLIFDNQTFQYKEADVLSVSDYYPFGMLAPDRQWNSDNYRFGFGSQEKDDEIYGQGNSYTAEFWQYDTRLGRRWNLDPVLNHSESGYACFSNSPIFLVDKKGNDGVGYLTEKNGQKTLIIKASYYTNNRVSKETQDLIHKKMNNYKGTVSFNGERVNVEFQIDFQTIPLDQKPEDIAGSSNTEKFNEGKNTFKYGKIPDPKTLAEGNRLDITVDNQKVNNDPEYEATVLVEEIGHNIGFLHKDGGIMSELIEKGVSKGNMTKYALVNFVNRLNDMTKSSSSKSYWTDGSGRLEINNGDDKEKQTGTTRVSEKYNSGLKGSK